MENSIREEDNDVYILACHFNPSNSEKRKI